MTARGVFVVFITLVCACGSELPASPDAGPTGPVDLTVVGSWRLARAGEDIFERHLGDRVPCTNADWHEELGGLEVNTVRCGYISLVQRVTSGVPGGNSVEFPVWWNTLASTGPATGHVALAVGTQVLWEEQIPLPAVADVRSLSVPVPNGIPPGMLVTFHVHNHGYNAWHLGPVRYVKTKPGVP